MRNVWAMAVGLWVSTLGAVGLAQPAPNRPPPARPSGVAGLNAGTTASDMLRNGGMTDTAALRGSQASGGSNAIGIQRNLGRGGNLGDFPVNDTPPPPRPANAPTGPLGSTGAVAEHGPQGQLRGGTGPAPGEIDMTRPIGPADVARLVRRYDPQMRGCYERAVAGRRNAPAGRVNMRIVINRDGSVSNPDAAGLPELPAVATCIRQELAQMRFPRPESGVLPFNYAMNFVPPPPPPPTRGRRPPPRR